MKSIAIIPARGGSKRIPRKNILNFLGKPIIAYSIEQALESGLFDEVMVSTDDLEIADISMKYGASIPFLRSKENSDDFATTLDVLLEVNECYLKLGKEFDFSCCIYPTAPLLNRNSIKRAYYHMIKGNFDSVFPVVKYAYPIQRALRLNPENRIEMIIPQHFNTRTQDLESSYHDSGQFYWYRTEILKTKTHLWTNNSGVIILSEMSVHDIDSPEDWIIAEQKYKLLYHESTQDLL